ncbi:Ty3/gypsy retrotransposon protein, partial [Trifolium pratense]
VKEQERNLIGICQDRAAGIYGIVCEKSTSTGPLANHDFMLPQPGYDTMLIERKQRRDIVAENLAQLMYSVMMTGYMFRNAQYRLELQESLEQVALPDVQDKKDIPDYASGTQKNVSGEVIRWNNISGPERMDAKKYIEILEAEIEELNRQVGRQSSNAQNELLEYLKSLEPRNLKDLTSSAGEDVVFAMNTFIKRLLAVADPSQMKTSVTETSASELAKLLYWLMVVGYSIRNIEVRYDMERVLGTSPKLAELPPGENV